MAMSVTSPNPIASRRRATAPMIRTSQISPPPAAMPTSAVSRPSQWAPPGSQAAAMAIEPTRASPSSM